MDMDIRMDMVMDMATRIMIMVMVTRIMDMDIHTILTINNFSPSMKNFIG